MNILAEKLSHKFEQVQPMDFYREIFPDGELDELDAMTPGKYTGIALEILDTSTGNKRTIRRTVTDDLDVISELQQSPGFCIIAPISYAGKCRLGEYARFMYALVVELDHLLEKDGLETLINQWSDRVHLIPKPTYTIASGTGLHLYYLFEEPIALYPNVVAELAKYKRELTKIIWNRHVTHDCTKDKIQQESIFQAFRMVGTLTKLGDRTEAFRTGEPVTLEYMNRFVPEKYQATLELQSHAKISLDEAKEKYPDWYQRIVVEKQPKGHWCCNRGLYDWWKKIIEGQAVVGHRYYCMMILAIYAVKCNISREELEADCNALQKVFEARTDKPENHFTEKDVSSALKAYDDPEAFRYPLNSIIALSGIEIQKNKRNGRKQRVHLKIARATLDIMNEDGGKALQGRPDKKETVRRWQRRHPEGTKKECIQALGLDPKTVRKWWNE